MNIKSRNRIISIIIGCFLGIILGCLFSFACEKFKSYSYEGQQQIINTALKTNYTRGYNIGYLCCYIEDYYALGISDKITEEDINLLINAREKYFEDDTEENKNNFEAIVLELSKKLTQ